MSENKNTSCQVNCAEEKPAKYFIKFGSVAEANAWLRAQNSIVITNFALSTRSVFSFPVNKIEVCEVRMEYIRYSHPTNYHYGIDEQDFVRVYSSAKTEKLRNNWKSHNPDKLCVQCIKSTNKRFLMGSGFGFISFVRDKFAVLYR